MLATRNISAWTYSSSGGYIGVWFVNASDALFNDFGGGTVTSSATSTPTKTSTPTNATTVTKTPTKTNTPAGTNTPTKTSTPAATFTPSFTPTFTATSTSAPLPTSTQPPAFTSANFIYDGDGRRVKSIIGGETTIFVGAHYEATNGIVIKYYNFDFAQCRLCRRTENCHAKERHTQLHLNHLQSLFRRKKRLTRSGYYGKPIYVTLNSNFGLVFYSAR